MPNRTNTRWYFLLRPMGIWQWHWKNVDGSECTPSIGRNSFGAALSEAIDAGFKPNVHSWLVEDEHSVTDFSPGEAPQILQR